MMHRPIHRRGIAVGLVSPDFSSFGRSTRDAMTLDGTAGWGRKPQARSPLLLVSPDHPLLRVGTAVEFQFVQIVETGVWQLSGQSLFVLVELKIRVFGVHGSLRRNSAPDIGTGQEAKRMGSALVSAGLVELALFTMT